MGGRNRSRAGWLERWSTAITAWTGSTAAFAVAVGIVLVWAMLGPVFHYSDTWQLVINTGTTIVTFLMVFLIQRSQNKDSLAVQLKLNELVAAMEGASNRLIDVEDLSEEELKSAAQVLLAARADGEEGRKDRHVALRRGGRPPSRGQSEASVRQAVTTSQTSSSFSRPATASLNSSVHSCPPSKTNRVHLRDLDRAGRRCPPHGCSAE